MHTAIEDARGTALCLNSLGDTAAALANYAEANRCYQSGLAIFEAIGNQSGAAASLNRLGYNTLMLRDTAGAQGYFHMALRTAWDIQAIPHVLDALAGRAMALADTEPDHAIDVATLVWRHAATTKDSRDRAAGLLERLRAPIASTGNMASQRQPEIPQLDTIVAVLLREM